VFAVARPLGVRVTVMVTVMARHIGVRVTVTVTVMCLL